MEKRKKDWFKFGVIDYLKGNIVFCSEQAQGLFAEIESMYWVRDCELNISDLAFRFQDKSILNELVEKNILKLDGSKIIIEYMSEQFAFSIKLSEKRAQAGVKAAKVRWGNKQSKEKKNPDPKVEPPPVTIITKEEINPVKEFIPENAQFFYIGTKQFLMLPSQYLSINYEQRIKVWCMQQQIKPETIPDIHKLFDKKYNTQMFNDLKHVFNSFNVIAIDYKEKNKTTTSALRNKPDLTA